MSGLWDQSSKPGWENLGGSELRWETQWWEQWSDAEWAQWEGSVVGGDSSWEQWSDAEWETWWDKQTRWDDNSWEQKKLEWVDTSWLDEMAPPPPTPAVLNVTVPEGVGPGSAMQVRTPEGTLVTVTVPEGIGPGGTFAMSYTV